VFKANFREVIYADDTIVFSESRNALQQYVQDIENEGRKYGMQLNRKKCEAMCIRGNDKIFFSDGTMVPPHDEAKYLGCMLNDKADPAREVNKRIAECHITWKRLAEFWKHSDCSAKVKINIFDAVIRSKLIYGLESVQVNDSLKSKLDAFQHKGLRQILKMQSTYVNRANTNQRIFERANIEVGYRMPGTIRRKVIPVSECYEQRRRILISKVIKSETDNPISDICIDRDNLKLHHHDIRRVGRPKNNWWICGIANFFEFISKEHIVDLRGQVFSFENQVHVQAIKTAVDRGWGVE
jgi:hypothetical protein